MTRIDNDESRRLYSWLREVIKASQRGQVRVYVKIRRKIPASLLALQVSLGLPVTYSSLPLSTPSTTLYRDGRMVISRCPYE